jgi:hypothetical protein
MYGPAGLVFEKERRSMTPLENPSSRKLIAGFGIIGGLVIYVTVCVWLAISVLPQHWLVELVFYPIAGCVWIWPAARLVRWSAR